MRTIANERKILIEFIMGFNPLYTKDMLIKENYDELIIIVKEIVKEL